MNHHHICAARVAISVPGNRVIEFLFCDFASVGHLGVTTRAAGGARSLMNVLGIVGATAVPRLQ